MEEIFQGDPQQLLSMVTQQAGGAATQPTPETPPENIGEIPFQQFVEALKTFSGGAIEDPNDIRNLPALRQKVGEYESKINELTLRSQASPFASPLVQKINELASNGATQAELQKFLQYQSLDPQTLPDIDAYRKQLEFKYPMLDSAEITAMIDDQFNPDALAEKNPMVTAKMKVAAQEARAYLQQLKVDTETPQSVQNRMQQEQVMQRAQEAWGQIINTAGDTLQGKFAQKFDDGEGYDFAHKYTPEALARAKQDALAWAIHNRIPWNQDGLQKVMEVLEQQAVAYDYRNLTQNLATDVWSKAVLAAMKKTAGGPPPAIPSSANPVVPQRTQGDGRPDPTTLVTRR